LFSVQFEHLAVGWWQRGIVPFVSIRIFIETVKFAYRFSGTELWFPVQIYFELNICLKYLDWSVMVSCTMYIFFVDIYSISNVRKSVSQRARFWKCDWLISFWYLNEFCFRSGTYAWWFENVQWNHSTRDSACCSLWNVRKPKFLSNATLVKTLIDSKSKKTFRLTFSEVLTKQFFQFYDYYVEICTENITKDGKPMAVGRDWLMKFGLNYWFCIF